MTTRGGVSLRLSREYPVPREDVYRAWTDPVELRRWLCPPGGSCPSADLDVRVGGAYRVAMRDPFGKLTYMVGRYVEVTPVSRLVFTMNWEELPLLPRVETLVTVEFQDLGGTTRMMLIHEGLRRGPHRVFHAVGWKTSLRRLARITR